MPRLTGTPFNDEIAYRRTFAIAFAIALQCFKWGNIALQWSAPCFAYRSSQSDDFLTADQRFQNGHRVKKKGRLLFSGMDSSLTGQQKWPPYGGFLLKGESEAHRNVLKGFQCIPMGKKLTLKQRSSIQQPFSLPLKWGIHAKTQQAAIFFYPRPFWNRWSAVKKSSLCDDQ